MISNSMYGDSSNHSTDTLSSLGDVHVTLPLPAIKMVKPAQAVSFRKDGPP